MFSASIIFSAFFRGMKWVKRCFVYTIQLLRWLLSSVNYYMHYFSFPYIYRLMKVVQIQEAYLLAVLKYVGWLLVKQSIFCLHCLCYKQQVLGQTSNENNDIFSRKKRWFYNALKCVLQRCMGQLKKSPRHRSSRPVLS